MANDVFANGRELACKAGDGNSLAAFPDVCFTPPQSPATPLGVPLPYPNTAFAKYTANGSKSVKISGKAVALRNRSYLKTSTGDEAGCAPKKGYVTSSIKGKAYFKSWSPNVKFESMNVLRHLDITTHNHRCDPANESLPWPFLDSISLTPGSACDKQSPNDYATQVKNRCTNPPEDCYTPDCCKVRTCMLIPFSKKCCSADPDDEGSHRLTAHHPIPFQDHYDPGSRNIPKAEREEALIPGAGSYDGMAAPCICAEGPNHNVTETLPTGEIVLQQHGRMGRSFAYFRSRRLKKPYTYQNVRLEVARIIAGETGCDKDCILSQMDHYHITTAKAIGDLRKSRQPYRGGDVYTERHLGPEETPASL